MAQLLARAIFEEEELVNRGVVAELHQLAYSMVVGETAWPMTSVDVGPLWQKLTDSGLVEKTSEGSFQYTKAGTAVSVELLLACIGAIEVWDIPFVLEAYGHASDEEAIEVWQAETEAEALRLLKLLISRAYFSNFISSKRLH